jgi:hypothetical protein
MFVRQYAIRFVDISVDDITVFELDRLFVTIARISQLAFVGTFVMK